ncbi:MAG: class II aldolase/adducin family protein [Clostridia bacterium]|nr:class II aldolase/adducin family protein [Clostridia bacterium]MBQ8637380.1 class II aldolase/adducin family protein [Clostridia bacterium]
MLENLKYKVWEANRRLAKMGLAKFDWGGISYADRDTKLFIIKPDGIDFDELLPESFVVIDFDGNILEGENPSSDWKTHLELYKSFGINAVAHFYSDAALGFAAASRPIPVFSAVHAKYFKGDIPATRLLTKAEIENDYYVNIGKIVAEAFKSRNADEIPAVIVSGHEPYAWGKTLDEAVKNAAVLEEAAKSALCALSLSPGIAPLSNTLVDFLYKE